LAFTITTVGGLTTLEGTSGVDTATAVQLAGFATIQAQAFESADFIQLGVAQNGSTFLMGEGDDTFQDTGFAETLTEVKGGQGDDVLNFSGALTLSQVRGGKGIDVITSTGPMSNNSSMNGGKGADILSALFVQTNSSVNGGDGNDGITVVTLITGSTISGGAGNDLIGVTTSDNTTTIFGGDGNDGITMGGFGNAFGDAGDDTITGGAGANSISGGTGNDVITGNGDIDLLSGGTGANTFIFATPAIAAPTFATDVITDWRSGDGNKIDYANALNKLTNTAPNLGVSINGAGILSGAANLGGAAAYFDSVDTANSTAIWNNGSSAFLFVSNGTANAYDIIQLNNLNATGFTIDASGNISAIA